MWMFITQLALATTIGDFTNALVPLLLGLVSVVWFSASMLLWVTPQRSLAQKIEPRGETTPTPAESRAAA